MYQCADVAQLVQQLVRKWVRTILEEFTLRGYIIDNKRLSGGGFILADRYFE
jgi:hypothetical protein